MDVNFVVVLQWLVVVVVVVMVGVLAPVVDFRELIMISPLGLKLFFCTLLLPKVFLLFASMVDNLHFFLNVICLALIFLLFILMPISEECIILNF